jgi:hypothetical protein
MGVFLTIFNRIRDVKKTFSFLGKNTQFLQTVSRKLLNAQSSLRPQIVVNLSKFNSARTILLKLQIWFFTLGRGPNNILKKPFARSDHFYIDWTIV